MARPGLFVDAGILVASVVKDDPRHPWAAEVLRSIGRGAWSQVVSSDLVVAEAPNFVRMKVPGREALEAVVALVVGEPAAGPVVTEFARVHGAGFAAGWDALRRCHDRGLSFTDCTSLVLARELGIANIATFDRGLDAFLRVVPEADS